MNTSNNTVLITGGSAGIGFEIARLLSERGNRVIITGRNQEKLDKTTSLLKNVTAIKSDVTSSSDVDAFSNALSRNFGSLNMVINNAGIAFLHNLATDTGLHDKAQKEMITNYLSVVRLNEKLLPILTAQKEAAIVNVSSIVAYVPGLLATYSATKAALHSYTQSLRIALEQTPVRVFELLPPLVNTEFSQAIGGHTGIAPKVVAERLLAGLQADEYEIRVGQTEQLYQLFLSSPSEALHMMNNSRRALQAQSN